MKKIAFINQRYGLEVNGGSEYYTRLMAEHLCNHYEVHVLTTKALDYMTWEDYYECDTEQINDVIVHRFSVDSPRNQKQFNHINSELLGMAEHSLSDEKKWIEEQGPLCRKLIQYIEENKDIYDVFIFVTYLYYLTSVGLPKVAEKSILIPTAHDEPYIYFKIFKEIFCLPKAIIFLTDEERQFVQKTFHNQNIIHDTFAVGIDIPKNTDAQTFYEEKNLSDYIVYVGRIDENKGCQWLFQYFREYKKRNPGVLKLVLMGKSVMNIPQDTDIVTLGFVSEEEKFNGIAGAKALILPSQFESLSISALEAMSVGTPVIMNGKCEVLKAHCVKSNAGLYYNDYFEFEACVKYLTGHEVERKIMGKCGIRYIENNYCWDVILDKFDRIVDSI